MTYEILEVKSSNLEGFFRNKSCASVNENSWILGRPKLNKIRQKNQIWVQK